MALRRLRVTCPAQPESSNPTMLSRPRILAGIGPLILFALLRLVVGSAGGSESPPKVILILADDLAVGDLSAFNGGRCLMGVQGTGRFKRTPTRDRSIDSSLQGTGRLYPNSGIAGAGRARVAAAGWTHDTLAHQDLFDRKCGGVSLHQPHRGFNQSHDRFGTLWAERFKSTLVEPAERLCQTMAAYIDLDCVRAGLVTDPKEYRSELRRQPADGAPRGHRTFFRIVPRNVSSPKESKISTRSAYVTPAWTISRRFFFAAYNWRRNSDASSVSER